MLGPAELRVWERFPNNNAGKKGWPSCVQLRCFD